MAKSIQIGDHLVGSQQKTFVIAEAGINHNGELESAIKMAEVAKELGVNAIKFQTFTAQSIMIRTADSSNHLMSGTGHQEDVYSFVQRVSLSREAHQQLFSFCRELDFIFLSMAGTPEGVDLLEELGVPAFKVASMDLNNLPLLDHIARKRKPIILSTGMGTLGEIERALDTIFATGNDEVIVLHCSSLYPPRYEEVNLRAMDTIRSTFGVLVGYSDHTVGNVTSIAAVARGACVIEKHFTLDKKLPGPDQAVSGDPNDFRQLVNDIRIAETTLGSVVKKPVQAEQEMKKNFRRSIIAAVSIPKGTKLTKEMLTFKRPGTGISPADLKWVVGRVVARDIVADTLLAQTDLT